MTKIDLKVADATVDIATLGDVSIKCATNAVDLTLRCEIGGYRDIALIRAMYEASREWLILNREIDAPQEAAA